MFSVDLTTRPGDGYVVVELRGERDVADAAAVAAREPDIIVDLAALEFIDSSRVAALGHGRRQARRAGGDLLLAAPEPAAPARTSRPRLVRNATRSAIRPSASGSADVAVMPAHAVPPPDQTDRSRR
jgi:anti-anti-sigma factor